MLLPIPYPQPLTLYLSFSFKQLERIRLQQPDRYFDAKGNFLYELRLIPPLDADEVVDDVLYSINLALEVQGIVIKAAQLVFNPDSDRFDYQLTLIALPPLFDSHIITDKLLETGYIEGLLAIKYIDEHHTQTLYHTSS